MSSVSPAPIPRIVLYEELAEYYYRAVASERMKVSTVNSEIALHVKNITLLSLYFDSILITSATIFNARDPFVSKIVSGFLAHQRTREMLQFGVLKIVGWGSAHAKGMFDAASDYAGSVLNIQKDKEVVARLRTVFSGDYTISRTSDVPDGDLAEKYIHRMQNTSHISYPDELSKVTDVVRKQKDRTGSLIAIEMLDSLEGVAIIEGLLNRSKIELFGVTLQHMREELPNLWVYSPFLATDLVSERASASSNAPRAFLLSPMIFGSFLSASINPRIFSSLMEESYQKLFTLRNGDWKRFVDAYHQAILEVSDVVALSLHLKPEELRSQDANAWAEQVISKVENGGLTVDIAAFLDSLSALGGIVMGVPILRPLAKLISTAVGERISRVISKASESQRSHISPFITKIEKAYVR